MSDNLSEEFIESCNPWGDEPEEESPFDANVKAPPTRGGAGADPGPKPPASHEIEAALIGALLLCESRAKILEIDLQAEYFDRPSYREMALALRAMAEEGVTISPLTLLERLQASGSNVTADVISDTWTDHTRFSTEEHIDEYLNLLKGYAARRKILRLSYNWYEASQNQYVDPNALIEAIQFFASKLSTTKPKAGDIGLYWRELCEKEFPKFENIFEGVERGEVVLLSAVTGRGKTTLCRNIALSAACGRAFAPALREGPARKVMYLDFETRQPKIQKDIMKMLGRFTEEERGVISDNLHIVADQTIDDLPFSLSNPDHMRAFEAKLLEFKPDIVFIDTLTMAFDLEEENSNTHTTRIMKRIIDLATKYNCVIVAVHHIGKQREEGAHGAPGVNRSRGGSALEGCAPVIIYLLPDNNDPERFILKCAKIKDDRWPNTDFYVDKETRWCNVDNNPHPPPQAIPSFEDELLALLDGSDSRYKEIREAFPEIPEMTLCRKLQKLIDNGKISKMRKGRESVYMKQKGITTTTPKPLKGQQCEGSNLNVENKGNGCSTTDISGSSPWTGEAVLDFELETGSNPEDDTDFNPILEAIDQ